MISQAQDRGTHTIYHVVQIKLVISTHRDAGMLLADTNEDTDYTVHKYEEAGAARVDISTTAPSQAVNIVVCCNVVKPLNQAPPQ